MIKKYILTGVGFLFFGLGVLGTILPLMPATPFFLVSAFCFIRSSKSLYKWLVRNRYVGKHIRSYIADRAITMQLKVITVVSLWFSLCISTFAIRNIYVTIILALVGIGVTIHVLMLKTLKEEKVKKDIS